MSRKKIVAARTALAALGLGFAAMQVASANTRDERANYVSASGEEPTIGQCFRPGLLAPFRTAAINSALNNNKSDGESGNADGSFFGFNIGGGGGSRGTGSHTLSAGGSGEGGSSGSFGSQGPVGGNKND